MNDTEDKVGRIIAKMCLLDSLPETRNLELIEEE